MTFPPGPFCSLMRRSLRRASCFCSKKNKKPLENASWTQGKLVKSAAKHGLPSVTPLSAPPPVTDSPSPAHSFEHIHTRPPLLSCRHDASHFPHPPPERDFSFHISFCFVDDETMSINHTALKCVRLFVSYLDGNFS
jgi:hypothetical protein